jgi:hypothetical protein
VRVGLVVVVGSGSGEDPCRDRHTPMAADGTGSPATPVAVGLAPSNTLVSLGDAAARPPLSFSLSPVDIGNRLDARGGYEKRYGIVLDGRLVLAAFQRMPSNSLAFARGRTGKRWPFSGAPHAPPLVSSPRGRRKEKRYVWSQLANKHRPVTLFGG